MDDERDADYAIRALDRTEFGRKGRRLRVEWTKHEQSGRKSVGSRKSANLKPSKTLFVINFPYHTKERDLERHFDAYGKVMNVRIRRNFAFVQYESLEDATKALDATNMSKMSDRVISVEYAAREDDDKRNGHTPDRRGRDRSPDRRRRSPGPLRRERGSPDYGAGSSPAAYRRERGSPEYGHGRGSSRSPRRVERGSPDYDHRKRSPSPRPRRDARASPDYDHHKRSPSHRPRREMRASPDYDHHKRSPSPRPRRDERASPDYDHRERSPSPRPLRDERASPDYRDRSRSPRGGKKNGNGYGHNPSTSPYRRIEASPGPDHVLEPRSPSNNCELRRDSPAGAGEYRSPLDDRHRSRSPVARERSRS